jgi:AraC family transcriptional activator of tynA and feaB
MTVTLTDTWSTQSVDQQQQFSFWREAVCEAFLQLEVDCEERRSFRGALDVRAFGSLRLQRVFTQRQHIRRTRNGIARSDSACIYVNYQATGNSIVKQRGREAHINPGEWYLIDSAEPFELRHPADLASVSIEIPHAMIADQLRLAVQSTALAFGQASGMTRLMADYMRNVSENVDSLGTSARSTVARNFMDMLFLTLTPAGQYPELTGSCGMRRQLAEYFIAQNLGGSDLSPSMIAQACHCSVRTLHTIFNATGMPVMQFVWQKRFERAHAELSSSIHRHRSIADIAFGCGFSNLSHFCRYFKERMEMTPSDWRRLQICEQGQPR